MAKKGDATVKTHLLLLTTLLAVLSAQVLWGQAENRMIPSYKTTTLPKIDGTIGPGEWDAAGPPIVVNQNSPNVGLGTGALPDDVYGGDDDLGFSFRTMWAEPWTVYFLVEITDDIAMDSDPRNLWERDQVELFFDGDDLAGSDDLESFQWWDHPEPFGKFGASRYTTYEGNPARMTDDEDNVFVDDEFTYTNVAAVATETGVNANYFVEYSVSLEPMYLLGTFDEDTITSNAGKIVESNTVVKAQIAISDDDNYDNGSTERSHTLAYLGLDDWRHTADFADLVFMGPYTAGTPGDFDGNGQLDAADIDDLTKQVASGTHNATYDLNADTLVNDADIGVWVKDLFGSWIGDANLDHEFSSSDLVGVLASGTYEADVNAVWSTGDFNGDARTNSSDLVAALADGGYELGPPPPAVAAVPEPGSLVLLLCGTLLLVTRRRF
jgi:hypothetical protein